MTKNSISYLCGKSELPTRTAPSSWIITTFCTYCLIYYFIYIAYSLNFFHNISTKDLHLLKQASFFQTQCASLRVTDCNQLLREASREAILRDDVCTAQCGFVLAASESNARIQQFTTPSGPGFPGFPPHTNNLRSSPTPASFNGFKLPDLSQFIGWIERDRKT